MSLPYPSKILLIHDIAYVLIQQRGKRYSREEKVASRSAFLLSMHVVLKTRCVNPKGYVRGF